MTFRSWRNVAVGLTAALAVPILAVSSAWACLGLISLTPASPTASAGGTVTLTGREFATYAPIMITLDSPTGPLLATLTPSMISGSGMSTFFTTSVTLPSDVSSGQHLIYASQNVHFMNGGNPARALIYVGEAAPAATGPQARPASLTTSSGPSTVELVVIGLAVVAVGLVVASWVTVASTRRRNRPEAEPVAAE